MPKHVLSSDINYLFSHLILLLQTSWLQKLDFYFKTKKKIPPCETNLWLCDIIFDPFVSLRRQMSKIKTRKWTSFSQVGHRQREKLQRLDFFVEASLQACFLVLLWMESSSWNNKGLGCTENVAIECNCWALK